MPRPIGLTFIALMLGAQACLGQRETGEALPPWTPGTLDIHQIQTGRGNAALIVFPDGTTLLFDAGAVPERPGPALGPARPNASRSPGEWIADYIRQFAPRPELDYAVITHYHDDHVAALATVAKLIPIHTLIDRGGSPAPPPGPIVDDYRAFRKAFEGKYETFHPGRSDQIRSSTPGCEIQNIAGNGDVWTGLDTNTRSAFSVDAQPAENAFSIALRIRYGPFRYYTGGDLPGVSPDGLPDSQDLETPVARSVGPVDVAVLNHHGWLDSTNAFFLENLRPRVVIIPAWHATHPDHGVLRRLLSTRIFPGPRDIFTTTLLDAPRAIFSYLNEPFKSTEGHIVVRVSPAGTYRVFILDDHDSSRRIIASYGPYKPQSM